MAGDAASRRVIGYCTNVHAGTSFEQTRANLDRFARAVKTAASPEAPLGVGLWLSHDAARQLASGGGAADFGLWLADKGLDVFTINGFPYGDFHRPRVKHDVYEPDWRHPSRLAYTLDLIEILEALVPPGGSAGISTLPLGWGPSFTTAADLSGAVANLRQAVAALAEVEQRSGSVIHLDLEPEPGCVLQRSEDVAALFAEHLLDGADDDLLRRHLRVCHDICHAAVMFEDQAAAVDRYDALGVRIGKVQVSAAVRADFDAMADADRPAALRELAGLVEPRYLHQTVVRQTGEVHRFYEDLPEALAAAGAEPSGQWRTHLHVPVFLERFGLLETTRDEIQRCVDLLRDRPEITAFEVETYTWEILPDALRGPTLADGIARELDWIRDLMARERAA